MGFILKEWVKYTMQTAFKNFSITISMVKLISDKIELKSNVTNKKEAYFIMIKLTTHQGDIRNINIMHLKIES